MWSFISVIFHTFLYLYVSPLKSCLKLSWKRWLDIYHMIYGNIVLQMDEGIYIFKLFYYLFESIMETLQGWEGLNYSEISVYDCPIWNQTHRTWTLSVPKLFCLFIFVRNIAKTRNKITHELLSNLWFLSEIYTDLASIQKQKQFSDKPNSLNAIFQPI